MTDDELKVMWNKDRAKTITFKTTDYSITQDTEGHTIYLNGSEQTKDWERNFKFRAIKVKWGKHTFFAHRGFYEAFCELLEDLKPKLKGIRYVNITGVSHGAAIGQLLHVWLKLHTNILIRRTTLFGSPKVIAIWNILGFYRIKKMCKYITFVRCGNDIVPTLPPRIVGYFPLKKQYKLKLKHNSFIEWIKSPFQDHCEYPTLLKDPNKRSKKRVY